jgi:hypothetical protein
MVALHIMSSGVTDPCASKEREMRKLLLATVATLALASPAMAFGGNAAPEPQCVINDRSP